MIMFKSITRYILVIHASKVSNLLDYDHNIFIVLYNTYLNDNNLSI